ncbi:hypothetical protein V6238_01540 [Marinomonas arenicola]
MHFDFTKENARRQRSRRMAVVALSALILVVGSAAEFSLFIKVGFL